MEDVQVIDNFLDVDQQDKLEKLVVENRSIPWLYLHEPALDLPVLAKEFRNLDPNILPAGHGAFIHKIIDQELVVSKFHEEYFSNIKQTINTKFQINAKAIKRLRINFLMPIGFETEKYDLPHCDSVSSNLKILIYYINDADGDTIIFKEKYEGGYNPALKTLVTRISPKKGRAVILDADRFHAASWPSKKERFVINSNFIV